MTGLQFNPVVIITASLHAREIINGALFVLCSNLALLLAYFMIRSYRMCQVGENWRTIPGMPTACILSWVFAVIGVRSGLAWLALRCANDGVVFGDHFEQMASWSLVVSAIILVIVTLRATYVWTPPDWHNKAWIASGVLAAIFVAISEWL